MKHLTLLGSTGSIGRSVLDVVRHNPEQYVVVALVANKNVHRMVEQCLEFSPRYAVMHNKESAHQLRLLLAENNSITEVLNGQQAACEMAKLSEVDQVISAIVGTAGLTPTLAAIYASKTILLANKESLVICGRLFIEAVKKYGACLLPIDSEHNAIFQSLPQSFQQKLGYAIPEHNGVSSILITGSGGPFREIPISALAAMTPKQACCHPNWSMGRKISVDSATMMNKGLEYIEARLLFNVSSKQVEILIHPQSVIHSMVRYIDGSVIAQLSNPDIRTHIAYSMAWPKRILSGVKPLDFNKLGSMTFYKPNYKRYPCLKLAIEAFDCGQAAIITLNAANEIAVSAFLDKQISFTEIEIINRSVLDRIELHEPKCVDAVLDIDTKARKCAREQVMHIKKF